MGWKSVVLLIVTVSAVVSSQTVLDGYLRRNSDDYCFNNNGADPEVLDMVTVGTIGTDCTKVTVTGDSTAGYMIAQSGVDDKEFTFALTDTTELSVGAGGTALKFVMADNTPVCSAALTASATGFQIDGFSGGDTGADCLKTDLTYTVVANTPATCDAELFYFETIDCSDIRDCDLCYDDAGTLKCSACGNNMKPNADNTACEACTGNTIVDSCGIECSACSATQKPNTDHNACDDCPAGEVQDSAGTACTACGTAMADCTACSAHDTCTACGNGKVLNEAQDMCITCGTAMADCTACSAHDTCTACGNDKVLNEAQDMCITCGTAITGCTVCTSHEVCTACTAGAMVPNGNGDACMACTSPMIANEDGTTCVVCSAEIDDCATCTSYQACTSCDNNKVLKSDGTMCEDLQGYLVFQGGAKCFGLSGSNPAVVEPESSSDIPTDCTKVKLSDHGTAGYVLAVVSDDTKQLTYASDTDATPLTLTADGTALKFVAEDNAVTEAALLVDSDSPVLVVQYSGENGGQDCMLENLTYENTDVTTSCDGKGWYIVLVCADLTITDCETCGLNDATKLECTSCGNEKFLSDQECKSCIAPEELNEDGTACEDTSGSGVIAPMHIGIGILMVAIGKIMA